MYLLDVYKNATKFMEINMIFRLTYCINTLVGICSGAALGGFIRFSYSNRAVILIEQPLQ